MHTVSLPDCYQPDLAQASQCDALRSWRSGQARLTNQSGAAVHSDGMNQKRSFPEDAYTDS